MKYLMIAVVGLLAGGSAFAQDKKTFKKPTWIYAHDLKVRKSDESDWDKAQKIGVEFYTDNASGGTFAITQSGQLAAFSSGIGATKKPEWIHGMNLLTRKADETKFGQKFGVEINKDIASGKLLYLSQVGSIAVADAGGATSADKDPVQSHGLILKVRPWNEEKFDDKAKKFGVEVHKDTVVGSLVYITEAGQVAAAPLPKTAIDNDKPKAPKILYGMSLRIRKADEIDFTDKTQRISIEVFRDENTGGLIYISEAGSICCVPAPDTIKEKQGVEWLYAASVKARPGGEPSFMKANKYGFEAFIDLNTGYYLFVTDVGGIAVLKK